jgi:diaminopimelate epimerase
VRQTPVEGPARPRGGLARPTLDKVTGGGVAFVKGHGTENDFVVLPDFPGDLEASLVRAVCDRRAGIGADGVLRVLREGDGFFMDYRNADGSIAEMCGNGIRVFARYLVTAGLASPGELTIGTRSGPHRVTVPTDGSDITAEMGMVERLPDAEVAIGGAVCQGVGYGLGNPHLVVLGAGSLEALDLTRAPEVRPAAAFPDGVNIEFTEPLDDRAVRMRVFERGVGETRSCGTGACAAAVAVLDAAGLRGACRVEVPGGRLEVEWGADGMVSMTGPAVLVAEGQFDPALIRSSAAAGACQD